MKTLFGGWFTRVKNILTKGAKKMVTQEEKQPEEEKEETEEEKQPEEEKEEPVEEKQPEE